MAIAHGCNQGAPGAGAGFVQLDRRPAHTAVIVDGDMHIAPARTIRASCLAIAGHAMPRLPEPAEFLDIQMLQIAGS